MLRPKPKFSSAVARVAAVATILGAAAAISASPAMALTASHSVALIPSNQPSPPEGFNGQDGILPISTTVAGKPAESFGKFSFTNVALTQISASELAKFDTVVLNEVRVTALTAVDKTALSQFVANGGKLLIDDSDATHNNDYSWVVPGTGTTQVGAGCNNCGLTAKVLPTIVQNSGLISGNSSDPSYVNLADMNQYTDAVGDSNLLTSSTLGHGWFAAVTGQNAKGEAGAQIAFATDGTGLVVYNGFDTDMVMPTATSPWRCVMDPQTHYDCPTAAHEQADWVAQIWYNELNESWGPQGTGGLPTSTPVSSVGTPVTPGAAGLPSNTQCVARKSILLRLLRLVSHHNRKHIMRIDVFLNGRHRLKEHGHWHNVTLRRLPNHGTYVVKVVATTRRHYHLISRQRYHAC